MDKYNLTPREQAEQLFAKKKEKAEIIRQNLNSLPKKVEPKNDAPDLHSYNNFGGKIKDINSSQKKLNELFSRLEEKDKNTIINAIELALDYDSNIDWL